MATEAATATDYTVKVKELLSALGLRPSPIDPTGELHEYLAVTDNLTTEQPTSRSPQPHHLTCAELRPFRSKTTSPLWPSLTAPLQGSAHMMKYVG